MKMSDCNSKIGKIKNISLTPGAACQGCADYCLKDCYAMKSYKQYPATRAAWDHNLNQATNDRSAFFKEIDSALKSYKGRFFRWHVAGDILDTQYFYAMCCIAHNYPNIKFLAFTKQYAVINYMVKEHNFIPSNMTVIFSAWPGLNMPNPHNFPVAYMVDERNIDDRIPKNALECPGKCDTCGMCWNLPNINRDVVFRKH